MKKLIVLVLLFVFCMGLVACENVTPEKVTNTKSTTQTDSTASAKAAPKTEVFKIGDVVKAGKAQFTVNSVREDKGNEFIKPKEGNTYYIVNITVENKASEAVAVSSLMMFKLVDSEGYNHDITVGPETKGSLDGELSAGRKMRGEIVFEIAKSSKGLELEIDPSLWGTGKVIVKLDR